MHARPKTLALLSRYRRLKKILAYRAYVSTQAMQQLLQTGTRK